MKNALTTIVIIALVLAVFWFLGSKTEVIDEPIGAIIEGQAYNATTTRQAAWTNPQVLKSRRGELGSVTITGAAAGTINLYNATTTNINARTGQTATSSILLATFPDSTAAGTYALDTTFGTALLVDIIGTVPTTTITWR